jgi:hypothetical protein
MEIIVTEMEPMVDIEIRTRFSYYIFRITEPRTCKGFLSGGRLGAEPREAFLANTFLPANRCVYKTDQLGTGYRAMFHLEGSKPVILTTSVIMELRFNARPATDSSAGEC